MNEKKLPEKWQRSEKVVKAVQVAFDMDSKLQYSIRRSALVKGISPSEQIRHLLGLTANKKPKRPRLTVSLNSLESVEHIFVSLCTYTKFLVYTRMTSQVTFEKTKQPLQDQSKNSWKWALFIAKKMPTTNGLITFSLQTKLWNTTTPFKIF